MSTGKTFLLLCISGFLSCTVLGQELVDSLERKLGNTVGAQRVDVLNQLTYEFITHDNAKVIAYNTDALILSKKINYLRGEARAYTYRGVFEYLSGKWPEGHRDLNHGLRLAKAAGDRALQGYVHLQLGNCSLEEVQMDSALIFFQHSREVFRDSTDPATLSKLYRNISVLYGQRYQADSQQVYIDRSIQIRRLLPDKALLIEALVVKANTKLLLGELVTAQQLIAEAEEVISARVDDDENRNDIRRVKALILFQKGDFEEASVLFDSARTYFLKKDLQRKYVTLLIDLGRVFLQRGDYELALNNLYDASRISHRRQFDAEAAIIRIQIGWVNHYLGNDDLALEMINEAMRINPKKLPRGDFANALTLKGAALTELKKYDQARASLDSVLAIYKEFGSALGRSETLVNIGYLELQREKYPAAIQLYNESILLAEKIPNNYILAFAHWGKGHASLKLKDYKSSLIYLNTSQRYARIIGSSEVLVYNYNTRRDWLASQHRFEEALKFSRMANQLSDSLRRSEVARRFVNLEKIQEIEQRNRDIRSLQADKVLAENKIDRQETQLKQQSVFLTAGLIGLLILVVLAFVYYRVYRRIKNLNVSVTEKNSRIQAQADKLLEVNVELNRLYQEVSEQKKEIQYQTDKLSESNAGFSDMNRRLEKMVAEKTLELRKINTELIKQNNELFQFSYTVSHNLRGPVARLLGLADLAGNNHTPSEAKQLVNFINATAFELDEIVNDLINILELRNEHHHYRQGVDLEEEWLQAISLLKDTLKGNEEIVINFKELPTIPTVRSMFQNVLYNLLSNAIKFKSPERKLKIVATSRIQDGNAVLEISDNGLGFNTERHHEKIFKLYRRFHANVGGRGRGLYLIKVQVELLHGSVDVKSEVDKGSTFRVILPLSVEESLMDQEYKI